MAHRRGLCIISHALKDATSKSGKKHTGAAAAARTLVRSHRAQQQGADACPSRSVGMVGSSPQTSQSPASLEPSAAKTKLDTWRAMKNANLIRQAEVFAGGVAAGDERPAAPSASAT